MNDNEFVYLSMIAVGLIIGFIIGTICCIILNLKENKELKKEVDKFRGLYFEELDKWKNKYDQDDYEAY
tara:strand:- start:999 stop:1205 length:207 start_codon:yes stop_codon:yes gene_type:complete